MVITVTWRDGHKLLQSYNEGAYWHADKLRCSSYATCSLQRGPGHRKFGDFRCSEVHSEAFWDTYAVLLATKISTDKE